MAQKAISQLAKALSEQGTIQKGRVHGDGFEIVHCQHGAGRSYTLYGEKTVNGWKICKELRMPGPFDKLAGIDSQIEEHYSVWVGWEEYNLEFERTFDAPPKPISLPPGATGWNSAAFDGPRQWFAQFEAAEDAEAWVNTLPQPEENPAPLLRVIAVQ